MTRCFSNGRLPKTPFKNAYVLRNMFTTRRAEGTCGWMAVFSYSQGKNSFSGPGVNGMTVFHD